MCLTRIFMDLDDIVLVVSHNLKACQFILPSIFYESICSIVPFCSTFLNISGPMGKFQKTISDGRSCHWLTPKPSDMRTDREPMLVWFTLPWNLKKDVFQFQLFFYMVLIQKMGDMGPIHCNDQWDFEVRSYFQRSLCWTQPIVSSQTAPRVSGDKTV